MTIKGGCLCTAIRYEITGSLVDARSCHCSRCRKVFSGAASAYAEVRPGEFRWLSGEQSLVQYVNAQGQGIGFCGVCGSTLCGILNEAVHGVTLGTVDGDPGVTIQRHIFVGSKAPWDKIGGDTPHFDENVS
jgi:hypothetical protein